MRSRLTYANVVATLALCIAVGGATAFAATQLGRNSVGARQLRRNSVITAKIKNQAVTAAKIKRGTLTGAQINASTLGTVPTAQTANAIAPPEPWHQVGAPGEPTFQNFWENAPPLPPVGFLPISFYRDQEGVVHLRGKAANGATTIFQLPPGYRPASGKVIEEAVACGGGPCSSGTSEVTIFGPNICAECDGAVVSPGGATTVSLDGVTFRAES